MAKYSDFDAEFFIDELGKQDASGQLVEKELSEILLSQSDFQHFKELILESKKNNLFLGAQTADDGFFNYENMFKIMSNKDEWEVINSDKKLRRY